MTEEERAQLYREQRSARCQARRARVAALAGNSISRANLALAWQPLELWLLERGQIEDVDDGCLSPEDELLLAN